MFKKIQEHLTQRFTEEQLNIIGTISGIAFGLIAAKMCQCVGVWLSEIFFL